MLYTDNWYFSIELEFTWHVNLYTRRKKKTGKNKLKVPRSFVVASNNIVDDNNKVFDRDLHRFSVRVCVCVSMHILSMFNGFHCACVRMQLVIQSIKAFDFIMANS